MASKIDERDEGRGLLAPMTGSFDSEADELDPRRVELRHWLLEHPHPSGRDLAEAKLVTPAWPSPGA